MAKKKAAAAGTGPKAAKGPKKKTAKQKAKAARAAEEPRPTKEARRQNKLERRRRENRLIPADMWDLPAPQGLVGKLDKPKLTSKYHSYFEFAENTEKKDKKLEFQVCCSRRLTCVMLTFATGHK
jgi:hypothetical protein